MSFEDCTAVRDAEEPRHRHGSLPLQAAYVFWFGENKDGDVLSRPDDPLDVDCDATDQDVWNAFRFKGLEKLRDPAETLGASLSKE